MAKCNFWIWYYGLITTFTYESDTSFCSELTIQLTDIWLFMAKFIITLTKIE